MSQAKTLASLSATVSEISAASAAWNSEESMVAVAVRICVSTGLFDHLRREARLLTHDLEGLGFAHLAGQFLDLAVVVGHLDGIARV